MNRAAFILILFPLITYASERPDWVDSPPEHDKTYYYFVGRSDKAENVTKGIEQAETDAHRIATLELFGKTIKVNSKSHEDLSSTSLDKSVEETSNSIEIHNLRRIKEYDENGTVWVLCRYDMWQAVRDLKKHIEAKREHTRKLREHTRQTSREIEAIYEQHIKDHLAPINPDEAYYRQNKAQYRKDHPI